MMIDSIRSALVPVHREGYKFIAIAAAVALGFFFLGVEILGWAFVVISLWIAYFFRDPQRVTPIREGLVISPADGRISHIEEMVPPPELDLGPDKYLRISVFRNVFDVHVNRAPVEARIARIAYVPGKFLNAELDKASQHNERQAFTLEMAGGERIGMVQIAGLVARRIVKFTHEGEKVLAGQRVGLIRFGSRVDVYLPQGSAALVAVGQRALAGETVLADLKSAEGERITRRG
jgi:phosphatidylserine decarboxylase